MLLLQCNNKVSIGYPLFITQLKIWTPATFCISINLCDLIPIPSTDLSADEHISDTYDDLIKEEVSLIMKDPNAQVIILSAFRFIWKPYYVYFLFLNAGNF